MGPSRRRARVIVLASIVSALIAVGTGPSAAASPHPPEGPDTGYVHAARALGVPGPDYEIEIEGRSICIRLAMGQGIFGTPPLPNLRPDIKREWAALSVAHYCPARAPSLVLVEPAVRSTPTPR